MEIMPYNLKIEEQGIDLHCGRNNHAASELIVIKNRPCQSGFAD